MKPGMVVFTSFNGKDQVAVMADVIHHVDVNEHGKTVLRCNGNYPTVVIGDPFFDAVTKINEARAQETNA